VTGNIDFLGFIQHELFSWLAFSFFVRSAIPALTSTVPTFPDPLAEEGPQT
jgi:hypothetical protein